MSDQLGTVGRVQEEHRLHKPVVAGSNPAAATLNATITHCPAEEYHSWPQTSCSQLKELANGPLGFYLRHVAKTAPPKKSDALSYGTLLHQWAEEGEEVFWPKVAVAPADVVTATGQLGKAAEPWKRELPAGAIPLSPVTRDQLWQQTRQILACEPAAEALDQTIDREFNVVWDWFGYAMRCRCDGATPSYWYDLKTTRERNPLETFWRAVDGWGYDLQAAVYEAAAVACGWPHHRLRFICTSNEWPHHCCVVTLPEAVVRRGRKRALKLLAELRQRMEWDSWYPPEYERVQELYCPKFLHEEGSTYE
jgi:hypothetical protein